MDTCLHTSCTPCHLQGLLVRVLKVKTEHGLRFRSWNCRKKHPLKQYEAQRRITVFCRGVLRSSVRHAHTSRESRSCHAWSKCILLGVCLMLERCSMLDFRLCGGQEPGHKQFLGRFGQLAALFGSPAACVLLPLCNLCSLIGFFSICNCQSLSGGSSVRYPVHLS